MEKGIIALPLSNSSRLLLSEEIHLVCERNPRWASGRNSLGSRENKADISPENCQSLSLSDKPNNTQLTSVGMIIEFLSCSFRYVTHSTAGMQARSPAVSIFGIQRIAAGESLSISQPIVTQRFHFMSSCVHILSNIWAKNKQINKQFKRKNKLEFL